jgi:hypothetical protein
MNNLKYILLILILFTTTTNICCHREWNTDYKEFWSSYLQIFKGDDYKMDYDCLDGQFNNMLDNLDEAILKQDMAKVIYTVYNIFVLEKRKCPITETDEIIEDIKTALGNGMFFSNFMKHRLYIAEGIVKYLHSKDHSYIGLGRFVGKITKILIYGAPVNFNENNSKIKFLN